MIDNMRFGLLCLAFWRFLVPAMAMVVAWYIMEWIRKR